MDEWQEELIGKWVRLSENEIPDFAGRQGMVVAKDYPEDGVVVVAVEPFFGFGDEWEIFYAERDSVTVLRS